MAYVIALPCIGVKDAACVTVCPMDCIHPMREEAAGFAAADQLYIDPAACIDCGLCVGECPVNAIFHDRDIPQQWESFVEKNAGFYRK